MIYTLFSSRLRDDLNAEQVDEYLGNAQRLLRRAQDEHPGFVDLTRYTGEDGDRLTVVRFSNLEAQQAWRRDPVHAALQRHGREHYYARYRLAVCRLLRGRDWSRG